MLPIIYLSQLNSKYTKSPESVSYTFQRHNILIGHDGSVAITFILMNEGIKSAFSRALAMREVTFGDWFAEMERGEPQVMVTITGHSLFNMVVRNASKLGYVPLDVSKKTRFSGMTFTTIFIRSHEQEDNLQ